MMSTPIIAYLSSFLRPWCVVSGSLLVFYFYTHPTSCGTGLVCICLNYTNNHRHSKFHQGPVVHNNPVKSFSYYNTPNTWHSCTMSYTGVAILGLMR